VQIEIISIYIASASAFISLGSFLFNWWSTIRGMEPHISGSVCKASNNYSYSICNKGGGPALIQKTNYYLNKQDLPKDEFEKKIKIVIESLSVPHSQSITTLGDKSIIGAGETTDLLAIVSHVHHPTFIPQLNEMMNLRIVIQYKSVHGKKKVFDSDD
jgi:hypothetical protein